MFYLKEKDPVLRFGDVLKGYVKTEPYLSNPILSLKQDPEYRIHISIPEFSVVLTPCCSIGPSIVTLTPLTRIRSSFLKIPYFAEDLTRINRIVDIPRNKFAPEDWEKLTKDEKLKHVEQGKSYAFLNLFIYDKNENFTPYELRKNEIRHYMIDFTRSYYLNCQNIKKEGEITEEIIDSKVLQLSIDTRDELRTKIAEFYKRIPQEDQKACDDFQSN